MQTIYRHTQVGAATLLGLGTASVAAAWWGLRAAQPELLTAALIVGVVLVLFSTLTVVVREGAMVVFFGPGLIRRRIPLRRIRDVRVVRTSWVYGWGIRLTPSGWLWNVSGLDGVELQFDDGHRFRVGTDEPTRLAEALRREVQLPSRES